MWKLNCFIDKKNRGKAPRERKRTKMNSASYPKITKLGLKIYNEPISHILLEDLKAVMSKSDRKKFSELFGVRTCILVKEKAGLYTSDVEGILEEMSKLK